MNKHFKRVQQYPESTPQQRVDQNFCGRGKSEAESQCEQNINNIIWGYSLEKKDPNQSGSFGNRHKIRWIKALATRKLWKGIREIPGHESWQLETRDVSQKGEVIPEMFMFNMKKKNLKGPCQISHETRAKILHY